MAERSKLWPAAAVGGGLGLACVALIFLTRREVSRLELGGLGFLALVLLALMAAWVPIAGALLRAAGQPRPWLVAWLGPIAACVSCYVLWGVEVLVVGGGGGWQADIARGVVAIVVGGAVGYAAVAAPAARWR